jgi:hypothetical protein
MFTRSGETWEYDNLKQSWAQNTNAGGPGPRCGVAMAYDEHRKVTVLFGGGNPQCTSPGALNADTWEYDGRTWLEVTTVGAPKARFLAAMVYDRARRRMVLFGGSAPTSDPITQGISWTYSVLGTPCAGPDGCVDAFCVDGVCCEKDGCLDGETCKGGERHGICVAE